MALSSRQAAPIVALHGGPSIPSNYLYPLEDVIPYRSIVFYDQLGCGKSDEPQDLSQYSIEDSVQDLKALLKKLGVQRFHLYGQSYGGILAFEYMKHVASKMNDGDNGVECLSAVLSSAPTNVKEVEEEFGKLLQNLESSSTNDSVGKEELEELFRKTHQCRLPEMPKRLAESYANAGNVWRGTGAISDYVAAKAPEDSSRMPSSLIMRGEFDFVSEKSVQTWKEVFNTNFLRYKTLEGCSHHGLFENGASYGEIVDSYFCEYD
jgi:proline iminopeptidase